MGQYDNPGLLWAHQLHMGEWLLILAGLFDLFWGQLSAGWYRIDEITECFSLSSHLYMSFISLQQASPSVVFSHHEYVSRQSEAREEVKMHECILKLLLRSNCEGYFDQSKRQGKPRVHVRRASTTKRCECREAWKIGGFHTLYLPQVQNIISEGKQATYLESLFPPIIPRLQFQKHTLHEVRPELFKCGDSQLPLGKLWPTESRKWMRTANKCQLTYFFNALFRCRILSCCLSKLCYKWCITDGVTMSLCGPWWSYGQHGNTPSCSPLFSSYFSFLLL